MKNLKPKMKTGYREHTQKIFSQQFYLRHLLLICFTLFVVNVSFAYGPVIANNVTVISSLGSPVITSTATISGTLHSSFSFAIVASNSPTSYTATTLPAGLTINATTGVISGTPTASGSATVLITVSNLAGTAKQTIVITIN